MQPITGSDIPADNQNEDLPSLATRAISGPTEVEHLYSAISTLLTKRFSHQIPDRLRSQLSIEDLIQETMLRIMSQLQGATPVYHPSQVTPSLVHAVAQRVLIDVVRRYLAKKRSPTRGFADCDRSSSLNLMNAVCGPGKTPSQLEIHKEFWEIAMQFLSPDEQELIALKYDENLSNDEIGSIYCITASSVRGRWFRLLEKLRTQFSKRVEYESYF